MPTPHNEANLGDIAKTVIMPGDPLRAKYIAENFLSDAKIVNQVRGIYAYTGTYQGKEITVMASGMGMPSMGIYSYELFKFYDVDNIIRIGSCGAMVPRINLFDIILTKQVYTESNYALTSSSEDLHLVNSSEYLNNKIINTAKKQNIDLVIGNTVCTQVFDEYIFENQKYLDRLPKSLAPLAAEMEAFSLFYNAQKFGKNAACLMTVVDSEFHDQHASVEDREKNLNKMIKLALDSI